ncbi:lipid II:glycine glycyltransferase FemX [Bacteroides sp.]
MTYFKVIGIDEDILWDRIIRTFPDYEVYYLSGYMKPFQVHGDGMPVLYYYERESLRAVYVAFKRDIRKFSVFKNYLEDGECFDLISPYGYGGMLFDGELSENNLLMFRQDYILFLRQENIISNFVRYYPLNKNLSKLCTLFPVTELGKTVSMALDTKDLVWNNISSKNRNMIRKAQKNGVKIGYGKGIELLNIFMEIYNATMDNDNATSYYYFTIPFYQSINQNLHENYEIFYAEYQGTIIAMSMIIYANNKMHYHLSGSLKEYRSIAPTNLLLYEAACWGCEQGFISFHLGGGLGAAEDSLYKFKQAFNRNSQLKFSIGKEIINPILYDKLVELRKKNDIDFDGASNFFPLYRA